MSGPARRFDHDEARTLYATGQWSRADLARSFGVSQTRISQIVDPAIQARARVAIAAWTRENYKTRCRSCGAPIWKQGNREVTGLCRPCVAASKRTAVHGTETMYTSRRCRCDDCKTAAPQARAARRARTINLEGKAR